MYVKSLHSEASPVYISWFFSLKRVFLYGLTIERYFKRRERVR